MAPVGMSGEDYNRIESSSVVDAPIGHYVRGEYNRSTFPNGTAYLFAFGAIVFPIFGLVATFLSLRGIRERRDGARWALLWSVLLTAAGVALWLSVSVNDGGA